MVNSKELLVAKQYLLPMTSLKGRKFQERKFEVENCSGEKGNASISQGWYAPLLIRWHSWDASSFTYPQPQSPTHSNDDLSKLSNWHLHNYQCQEWVRGISPAGQWLGLYGSMAEGMGSNPGRGTKVLHATPYSQKKKKVCKRYWEWGYSMPSQSRHLTTSLIRKNVEDSYIINHDKHLHSVNTKGT